MGFSQSGGVITQTGTDGSLNGLTGLAGVTVGAGGKKTYQLEGVRLSVEGVLTIDPAVEHLVIGNTATWPNITVVAAGVLNVGVAPSPAAAITTLRKAETGYSSTQQAINITSSGRMNHVGGTVEVHGPVVVTASAGACYFDSDIVFRNTLVQTARFRLYSPLSTFGHGAAFWGNGLEMLYTGAAQINNVAIVNSGLFGLHAGPSSSLASPSEYGNINITTTGGVTPLYPWGNKVWDIVDFSGGGNVGIFVGGNTVYTLVRFYGSVDLLVTAGGVGVECHGFVRDKNNGNRKTYSVSGGVYDETPDLTYSAPSDANGKIALRLLLCNARRDANGAVPVGGERDWRTNTPGANVHTIFVAGYSIRPLSVAPDLSAAGTKSLPVYAEVDSFVTHTSVTAAAMTIIDTLDDLYDALKLWAVDVANFEFPAAGTHFFTAAGTSLAMGNISLVVDPAAVDVIAVDKLAGVVSIRSNGLVAGIKLRSLSTTGVVTGPVDVQYIDASGVHTSINVTGYTEGARLQIFNVTTASELYNDIPDTGALSIPVTWTANQTIRVRMARVSGLDADIPVEAIGTLTSVGASFLLSPEPDTVYIENGIDGSTVTEFAPDYANVQVDVTDGDGATSGQRLYAWMSYNTTVPAGIDAYFSAVVADDAFNYRINQDALDLHLRNAGVNAVVIAGARLYRADGSSIFVPGVGPIQADPGKAYVASDIRSAVESTLTMVSVL